MEQEPDKPRNSLHRKLAEVMALTERVAKRGRNEFHKYDYATESDIVDAVRLGLAAHRVMLMPSVREVLREGTLTTVLMRFTFTDGETGEQESYDWAGTGDDKGDKGLYKAMTGALKYFLLKTFLLPTGDDPEADTETDKRASGQAPASRPKASKGAPTSAGPKCSRCGAAAMPDNPYCAVCDRLARERKADDEAPKPKDDVMSVMAVRKRAFALMDKYGIPSDAAHRPDRLVVYGKALGLGRLADDREAKAFTAGQWTTICEWLISANEPPDEGQPNG